MSYAAKGHAQSTPSTPFSMYLHLIILLITDVDGVLTTGASGEVKDHVRMDESTDGAAIGNSESELIHSTTVGSLFKKTFRVRFKLMGYKL